jgi:hypothetical protein
VTISAAGSAGGEDRAPELEAAGAEFGAAAGASALVFAGVVTGVAGAEVTGAAGEGTGDENGGHTPRGPSQIADAFWPGSTTITGLSAPVAGGAVLFGAGAAFVAGGFASGDFASVFAPGDFAGAGEFELGGFTAGGFGGVFFSRDGR